MARSFSGSVVPSSDVVESPVGDELVLLHLGNGTYYGLDVVGTKVWTLLRSGLTADAIYDEVSRTFDVAREIVRADIDKLFEQLLEQGIVSQGASG